MLDKENVLFTLCKSVNVSLSQQLFASLGITVSRVSTSSNCDAHVDVLS